MTTTIREAVRGVAALLSENDIEGAAREARLIVAHALDVEPGRLTLIEHDAMTSDVEAAIHAMVAKRAERVPMSHVLGYREFWGRQFFVSGDVLDPRPETETLIAAALEESFSDVLDLGTGSGAIAVTLVADCEGARGTATDLSDAALTVAARNARTHAVQTRLQFQRSDWFTAVEGVFDLIVSNPPYITALEMDGLQPEVRLHEPRMALTDEADGLSAYRAIFAGARKHLSPGGRIIVEFGQGQCPDVEAIAQANGWRDTAFRTDMSEKNRVLVAKDPV
ncbi:MAG: peptide chain release factor N(5)-glutamine methyltransferase [Rhodobacteraceae bacterium]|nr:peptide chain release factor N(5)-glutamine methyltransferase [Paracoccaceae bacterium]